MLDVKELTIEGYRSFGAQQKLVFRPGVFLLTGDNRDRGISASAGKSSIFKAITTALFERADDNCIKDAGINTVLKDNGYKIGVSFVSDGVHYYVSYSRKHPVVGTAWRLYRWDGSAWIEEGGAKLGDTGALIEKAIGMTYDQFVNNAYIPQHRVAEFIDRTDKERKVVFTKLLGLEACDGWLDTARQLRREAEDTLRSATAQAEILRNQLTALEVEVVPPIAQAEVLKQLDADRQLQASTQAELAAIEDAINRYSAHKAAVDRARCVKQEIDRVADEQKVRAAGNIKLADAVPETVATLPDMRTKRVELTYELNNLNSRLARVNQIGEVCSECERKLSKADHGKLVTKYTRSVSTIEEQLAQLIVELGQAEAVEAERVVAINRYMAAQSEYTSTDRYLESLRTELTQLQTYGKLPTFDLNAKLGAKATAQATLNDAAQRILSAEIRMNQIRDATNRVAALLRDVNQVAEACSNASARVACLKQCEEAIGDKGFRSYTISSRCGDFNASMSKYLSVLTNGEMRARLVTEVPRADGKGMKQELDIIVTDGNKEGVPISQYSGAEKAGLSLSITGAFWDLAAVGTGRGVNLLLLDEPLAQMDGWWQEQACRLFDMLRGDDRTVVVITNHDRIRELGTFDGEMRVVKENDISRLEEYSLAGEH